MLWLTIWGCGTATLQPSPKEPTTTDVIAVSATDQNGEFVAVTDVAWYRDGILTVDARELKRQLDESRRTVECRSDAGRWLSHPIDSVTIINSPPEVELTILPEVPTAGYPVTCNVEILDADEDAVTHGLLGKCGRYTN